MALDTTETPPAASALDLPGCSDMEASTTSALGSGRGMMLCGFLMQPQLRSALIHADRCTSESAMITYVRRLCGPVTGVTPKQFSLPYAWQRKTQAGESITRNTPRIDPSHLPPSGRSPQVRQLNKALPCVS